MGRSSDPNQSNIDSAITGCRETGRNISFLLFIPPIPVATRSKMWVCNLLLAGIMGSKLGCMNICHLLGFCVCCQVGFSTTGRSLVQRRLTLCGVPQCYLDTSTMRRPKPTRAVGALRKVCNLLPSLNNTQIFSGLTYYFVLSMKSYEQNGHFLVFALCTISYHHV
jgi:hypothetical protein